jgi:hypothetical protein
MARTQSSVSFVEIGPLKKEKNESTWKEVLKKWSGVLSKLPMDCWRVFSEQIITDGLVLLSFGLLEMMETRFSLNSSCVVMRTLCVLVSVQMQGLGHYGITSVAQAKNKRENYMDCGTRGRQRPRQTELVSWMANVDNDITRRRDLEENPIKKYVYGHTQGLP